MSFIITLALFLVCALTIPHSNDEWLGPDKPLHFAVSFLSGVVAFFLLPAGASFSLAFCLGMVPGLVKEVLDTRNGGSGWSNKDLVADALGAGLGVVLIQYFASQALWKSLAA